MSTDAELKPGQLVDIQVKSMKVDAVHPETGVLTVHSTAVPAQVMNFCYRERNVFVTVTHDVPASYPVAPGDVWASGGLGGIRYFAREQGPGKIVMCPVSMGGRTHRLWIADEEQAFLAEAPVLVDRSLEGVLSQ